MPETEANRRPLASRSTGWAKASASFLAGTRVTPNQVSAASVAFAAIGAALLTLKPDALGLIGCAAAIQARLVCNLLDGMVAIEGGKKSPLGPLYNEFPDRIADSLLIVALGYAIDWPALGWFGALAAALTAYIRVFGGALGLPQDFRGPMAKQQRMAALTVACVAGAGERLIGATHYALTLAAVVIAIGSLATCLTRTRAIAALLRAK
ncbi:MAG: CDP-alcohol phosphatidyltransferase family protein [Roseiarcus sp.]